MKDKTVLLIVAILAIMWLDTMAMLLLQIDGTVMLAAAASIAALATGAYYKSKEVKL